MRGTKSKIRSGGMLAILVLVLGPAICQIKIVKAAGIGTAWTYQGRLMDVNGPASGEYDLQFQLHSMASGHFPVGDEIAVPEVSIDDGYFTVELDFGSKAFEGDARWLEVGVRPGIQNDPNRYTLLEPRQELTATPYALYAMTAGNAIIGSGTTNRIAKFTGPNALGDSVIYEFNGSVGIGTTSTAEKLHVSGDIRLDAGGDIAFDDDNTRIHESSDDLYLEADDDIYISPDDDIRMDGDTLFVDGSENRVGIGTTVPGAPLEVKHSDWADIVKIGMSGISNRLILSSGADWASISGGTTNQDHIVIRHSTGKIGIGTTEPLCPLHVIDDSTDIATIAIFGIATNTGDVHNSGGCFQANGVNGDGVYGHATGSNGRGVAGSGCAYDFYAKGSGEDYGSASSIRWKKNIQTIDNPLDKILRLRGVYFDWDAEHGGQHDVGMIAEEVGQVLPEIVGYEENGIDATGMDYSKLTPLLVEAVKALKVEVDEQQKRAREKDAVIEGLQEQVAELKNLIKENLLNRNGNFFEGRNR